MVEKLMQLEAKMAVDDFQVLFLHSRWYSAQLDIRQCILDEVLKSNAAQTARAKRKQRIVIISTLHTGGDMKQSHEHHDNTLHVQRASPTLVVIMHLPLVPPTQQQLCFDHSWAAHWEYLNKMLVNAKMHAA
ncbi:uncharacterized protein PHACADRAFT_194586 [Phanerochaete carnosa HHB-10118-sp]|uniref:Uncharacterized protein n=1 Tax=Phanerochaete carnosa (strain HHB-10118-sp) TaxID=650164 RepID=K5V364_PHACS|nr:uncharacterized protein PHACADRAFT_194586 [Phanerochaete carnosa HHB-10118-sp]EKM57011.1 hypothetical protein PHACADRAFT_194586 [Phanerochaete carnosa HHB-10118-sp]